MTGMRHAYREEQVRARRVGPLAASMMISLAQHDATWLSTDAELR